MKGNDHGKKMDLVGVCGMTVCIIYMYMIDSILTILTHESFTCRIWLQERYVYVLLETASVSNAWRPGQRARQGRRGRL